VALLGAVLAQQGKSMLAPFTVALVTMGIIAALGGAASWFGIAGQWRRSAVPVA
jgi:hypothetical protein